MRSFLGSMTGRVFLLLLGGIVAAAVLVLILAAGERQEAVQGVRKQHAVERIEQLVLALDAVPAADRPLVATALGGLGIGIVIAPPPDVEGDDDPELAATLAQRLGAERRIAVFERGGVCGDAASALRHGASRCLSALVGLRDGTRLRIDLRPPRNGALPPRPQFFPYLLLFFACVAVLAYVVARIATRPLSALGRAANELGRDIDRPALPEEGPGEVREALVAFNRMQTRIRNHVRERTQVLAAIAHDLQTPLTRLRLRLEKVGDEGLRDKLVADLTAMQDLVREGLDLARSLDSAEEFRRVDLDSLLDSVCADARDGGQDVSLSGTAGKPVRAQPNALRRCLDNLIDNAVKYGGWARVGVLAEGPRIAIVVRDGGPGIPEAELEAVFEPFRRIETSRSRDTGGTGLGLTIARNIAEKHGGTLTLSNGASGGLEARLELPVS